MAVVSGNREVVVSRPERAGRSNIVLRLKGADGLYRRVTTNREGWISVLVRVKAHSGKLRKLWEYQLSRMSDALTFVEARPAEVLQSAPRSEWDAEMKRHVAGGNREYVSVWELVGSPEAIADLVEGAPDENDPSLRKGNPCVCRIAPELSEGLFPAGPDGLVPDVALTVKAPVYRGEGKLGETCVHSRPQGKAKATVRLSRMGAMGRTVALASDTDSALRAALRKGEGVVFEEDGTVFEWTEK